MVGDAGGRAARRSVWVRAGGCWWERTCSTKCVHGGFWWERTAQEPVEVGKMQVKQLRRKCIDKWWVLGIDGTGLKYRHRPHIDVLATIAMCR